MTIRPDHAACAVLLLAVLPVLLALALAARTQTPRRSPIAVADIAGDLTAVPPKAGTFDVAARSAFHPGRSFRMDPRDRQPIRVL
jgi:hypothetical protein